MGTGILSARAGVAALLTAAVISGAASAQPVNVANLEADFRGTGPIKGWNYLYNATGPLGTNVGTNYQPLASQGGQYAGPGGAAPVVGQNPMIDPAAYTSEIAVPFSPIFVRPGQGTAENAAGGFERAAIIAYTFMEADFAAAGVSAPEAIASITYYDFGVSNLALPDGMSARVYVDDSPTPVLDFSLTSQPFPFPFPAGFRFEETLDPRDIPLGTVGVGDTIYFALGANASSANDEMRLDFTLGLQPVPEPGAVALLAPVAMLLMRRRR